MPVRWLSAHVEAIPGLQAEENMRGAEIVAVGSGSLKQDASRRITAGWRRDAQVATGFTPTPRDQVMKMLPLMGIGRG